MTRRATTLLATAFGVAILLTAVPATVLAHAQLVSSSPGAGEVVVQPPTEVRLSFTEPIDPRYTSLDLLGSSGAIIVGQTGSPDPADPRVLVASVPAGSVPLDSLVTVQWRTLSAADGHVAQGFYAFGVGTVKPSDVAAAGGAPADSGQLHGGHSAAIAIVEVPARMLGYGGAMLAVGLAIFGYVVLRPAARGASSRGTPELTVAERSPLDSRDPATAPADPAANGPTKRGGTARSRGDPRRGGGKAPRKGPAGRAAPSQALMTQTIRRRSVQAAWSMADFQRAAAAAAGAGLLAMAAGCIVLLAIGVASLVDTSGTPDVVAFATGTRSGELLVGRIALGAAGGLATLGVLQFGGRARGGLALMVGGIAGFAGLMLASFGSHAAAFASPVPTVMDLVHLTAAGAWLAGLAVLVAAAVLRRDGRLDAGVMRRLVPRFSALGLVSVATIALTGVYADQLLTGDILSAGTPYELNLIVKIVTFIVALGFGAFNFLDGGEDRRWIGGLRRRLGLELVAGIGVLAIAANLTSGSPTAIGNPVAIEPAVSSVTSGAPVSLGVMPGRPGPNRLIARSAGSGAVGTVAELVLQRLDTETGISRTPMRADPAGPPGQFISDASLPVDSRWDATIVLSGPGGLAATQRFVFAVDTQAISEGRAAPFIDPVLLIAIVLLALGLLGLGYGLAGGVLPRTLPDASRPALLSAGALSAILGVAILASGVPH